MPKQNDSPQQDTYYAIYDQFSEYPEALFRDYAAALVVLPERYVAGRIIPVALPANIFDDLHISKVDP